MKKRLMTAMTDSISEVMETMFFIPVEIDADKDRNEPDLKDKPYLCRLEFSGEKNGAVIIAVPKNLLKEMTANFMGEDTENTTDELLNGTLKEMLNMVCGNALRRLNTSEPFNLGIPQQVGPPDLSSVFDFRIIHTTGADMAILLAESKA